MFPSRSSRLLAATLVLLAAAAPALSQSDPPSPIPLPDGPPAELGSTLLAGVRAAAAVPPAGGLLTLHPLDVFDLQACVRSWNPCAAPLVATATGPEPGAAAPRLLVSPEGSRLVFGAAALATAADGGAVAAWEAGPSCDRRTGTCRTADGDGTAVYVRPLRPAGPPGTRTGPLLRIHATAAGDQARPAAAAGPGGAFVVLWQSRGQDGSGWGVYGRRSGPGPGSGLIEIGAEIRIAPGTLGDQQAPAVALGADGGFLAAWQGDLGGTAGQGIFVRSFDAASRPRGRGGRIDSGGAALAADPALAAVPGGTFVIAWRSRAGAGTWHVFARRLGPAGRPLGPPLRLTPEPVQAASPPSVAADETGGFLVAWSAPARASGSVRQVAASYVDVADRLLAGGALVPRPGQDQHDPAVASDGRRSYGVVWSVSTVIRRVLATSYSALRLTLPPG